MKTEDEAGLIRAVNEYRHLWCQALRALPPMTMTAELIRAKLIGMHEMAKYCGEKSAMRLVEKELTEISDALDQVYQIVREVFMEKMRANRLRKQAE